MRQIIKKLKLVIAILASLGFGNIAKADFITAADLEYTCIGSDLYRVSLSVYTECGTAIGDLQNQDNLELFLRSEKLGIEERIRVRKFGPKEGEEIKIFCDQTTTNCTPGGLERGLEKFIYSVDLNLGQYGKTDDWVLYWQQDFRSSLINTTSTARVPYYVEARINNVIGCNSSPTFGENPIVRGCIGEANEYSLFPSDSDGDDLEFEFVNPKQTPDATINYATGNTKDFPVNMSSPVQISTNGTISFSPTANNQIGITDLLIKEFDNQGRLVGSITKGIQISTYNCANAIPEISGLNNVAGVFETSICVGEKLSDTIFGTDSDIGQQIHFEIISATRNNVLQLTPGATAKFNWTALANDVGRHEFNLKLIDDGCPINQFTSQTFIVNVNPLPTFNLGVDKFFNCNQPDIILEAKSDFGTPPFSASWIGWEYYKLQPWNHYYKDTISKDDELIVLEPGGYLLILEDANGCVYRDSVHYKTGMDANITLSGLRCEGDSITIENATLLDTGFVISAHWDLDDNGITSTELDSLKHKYPDNESHTIRLAVENNLGCRDTAYFDFRYCVLPSVFFERTDSCEITTTYWEDTTTYETCDIQLREWYVNGILVTSGSRSISWQPDPVKAAYNMPDSGWYDITMKVHSFQGCETEVTQPIYYYPKPIIEFMEGNTILDDFYINCAQSDTVLKVAIIDSANGNLVFDWNTNLSIINDTALFSNSTGYGENIVTDKIGCKDTTDISISFPVDAEFVYDTVCHDNVAMEFTNKSSVSTKVKGYLWEFGDGTTSNDMDPSHLFPLRKNYSVNLTVTDTNDCQDTRTLTVYNATILDKINFSHDFNDTIICAANNINGQVGLEAPLGTNLTYISWKYGNTTKWYGSGSPFGVAEQGRNIVFNFPKEGKDTIRAIVRYNGHTSIHNNYCTLEYEQPVEIFPFFGGEIRDNRVCLGDVAEFQFFRDGNPNDSSVADFTWTFKDRNTLNIIETSKDQIGRLALDTRFDLAQNQDLDVYVTVKDTNGCWFSTNAQHRVLEIDKAVIEYEPACANMGVDMDVYHFNEKARVLNVMYVTDSITSDTLFRFNAYDPDVNRLLDAPAGGYQFLKAGENKIRVFIVSETIDRYDLVKECRSVLDTSVILYDVPKVGFLSDTVCSKHFSTTLIDTSSIDIGTIESYSWSFEDNTTSQAKDTSHIFLSGSNNLVIHTATSDSGCVGTNTRSVYVHNTPDANFSFDSVLAEAFTPIDFYDESEFYGTSPDSTWYEFGDGSPREETFDANHTYDSVKVYFVKHAVNNEFGCWDTIIKRTDLNVYLDIANAFSPNGDLLNDEIGLIHKGIRELYEFKIFNRWGEVVFDAEGDILATWDGTFRGIDQEIGGYVVHVKALGAYDKEFNFKRNISLIR